ncbi:hypothetical protein N0V82_000664 [Gnomoniopsis sp. IMI 355080]|nr:hypothetical protein N0V82_000664 [Gnomoniopsis sp. IMI 355080]
MGVVEWEAEIVKIDHTAATFNNIGPKGLIFKRTVKYFNVAHNDFLGMNKASFERVAVSAVVSNPELEGRVLLAHRVAKDTFGNPWEVPGGMADRKDITLLHAVARELQEEACEDLGKLRNGNKAEYSLWSACRVDGFEVRLDPKEHQDFVWTTKKDVEDGRCGEDPLNFTTADQRQVVLDAFEWREIDCMW